MFSFVCYRRKAVFVVVAAAHSVCCTNETKMWACAHEYLCEECVLVCVCGLGRLRARNVSSLVY